MRVLLGLGDVELALPVLSEDLGQGVSGLAGGKATG